MLAAHHGLVKAHVPVLSQQAAAGETCGSNGADARLAQLAVLSAHGARGSCDTLLPAPHQPEARAPECVSAIRSMRRHP